MKSASVALNNHLNGELHTLVTCVKLTLVKYQPQIIAITNANPGVVTARWAHGLITGDTVRLANVRGMTEVNREEYQITRIDDLRFSIGVDTSAFESYTHKGVAQKVLGYTGHSSDIEFDGVTYKATIGYTPNSLRQGSDLAADSLEAEGILQNAAKAAIDQIVIDGITDEDLMAGRYDNARVEIFLVNYEDLSQGRLILPISGRLGEVSLRRGMYSAEMSGKAAYLQEVLQEVYSNVCRADLGDDLDGSEPEHELQQGFGCKVRLEPPYWQAATAYTVRPAGDAGLGSVVKPSVENGRQFKCVTAGTSGASEPVWDTTLGALTADGTAAWEAIEALSRTAYVHETIDRRRWIDNDRNEQPITGLGGVSTLFPITAVNTGAKRFTVVGELAANFPESSRFAVVGSPGNDGTYTVVSANNSGGNTLIVVSETVPDSAAGGSIVGRLPSLVGFYTYGRVTFLTGRNIGISREVKTFSLTSADGVTFAAPGVFEVFEPFPFDLQVGDSCFIEAGCDKSLVACRSKFDNVQNRRAEDFIPGVDEMLLYPDSK